MATKVTFTVDEVTLARLQDAASRLAVSKSEVGREAILEFHERIGRLSERERLTMLRTLEGYLEQPATRDSRAADRELKEIREARRAGGRKSARRSA